MRNRQKKERVKTETVDMPLEFVMLGQRLTRHILYAVNYTHTVSLSEALALAYLQGVTHGSLVERKRHNV